MNNQNITKNCILRIDIQTDQCYDNHTTKRGTQSATIQQPNKPNPVRLKENTSNVRIIKAGTKKKVNALQKHRPPI